MGINNIDDLIKDNTVVRISDDGLEATINLSPPIGKQEYTTEDIKNMLTQNKVTEGILEDVLEEIVKYKRYYCDIVVARGNAAVDGIDGSFEFPYKVENNKKPKVLEDGSVDYSTFGTVQVVEKGTVVAKYIPSTKGENGFTVKGAVLIAKNGKERKLLVGKGFDVSEDKIFYYANIQGKVEYGMDKITVTDILFIENEVNYVTGNVDFAGDIYIKGNVSTGMTVRALGNITIEGSVEAATIIAGKDIIFKKGMQGGQKGIAIAGGNISGKFFELTNIKARGNINANSMLNCDVEAEEEIVVSGRFGTITGGTVKAIKGIRATTIGNLNEMKTNLYVGVIQNLYSELLNLEHNIKEMTTEVEKIDKTLDKIVQYLNVNDNDEIAHQKRKLVRTKIEKSTELAMLLRRKEELLDLMSKTTLSRIIVSKSLYPGVKININGAIIKTEREYYNVIIKRKGVEVEILTNI